MLPLISVYVLNHNYGEFLECAIESVLEQTYQNIEIIIIDDCSHDNSGSIIQKYKKNKAIKVIRNKDQLGLIKSANIALKNLNGELVIRLDADDYFEKNAIELLFNNFIRAYKLNNDVVGIFGNYNEIDRDSNFIRTINKVKTDQLINELDIPIHGACTLIKKEWLDNIDGYDETFSRQDGYYLWALASATGKYFVLSEEVIFNYRQHNLSLSFNRSKILNERSKISQKIVSDILTDKTVNIIVPVRAEDIEQQEKSLEDFFYNTIEPLMKLMSLKNIILVSSSKKLENFITKFGNEKIKFCLRDQILEHRSTNIRETLLDLVNKKIIEENDSDIILIRSLSNKILPEYVIDQLFSYLKIFHQKDVAVLVRQVKGNLYKDLSNSLQKFSLSEKNHYERDVIYERINGGFAIRSNKLFDLINYKALRVGIVEVE